MPVEEIITAGHPTISQGPDLDTRLTLNKNSHKYYYQLSISKRILIDDLAQELGNIAIWILKM